MKRTASKILVVVTVFTVMGFGVYAFAEGGMGYGKHHRGWGHHGPGWHHGGYGCPGYGYMTGNMSDEDIQKMDEQREAYFKSTEDLRQKLYQKRLAMESEFAKKNPDAKNAANLHGRKYAVMYDLSGLASGSDIQIVVNDWMALVDNGKIPQTQSHDPAYMFHQGKPVVAVWGLAKNRPYEGQETRGPC